MQSRHPSPSNAFPQDSLADLHDGPTFHELLFEWMQRAPWLAISVAAHVIVLLVLSLIPWDLLKREEPVEFVATVDRSEPELYEEPEPEDIPEPETEVVTDEPIIHEDVVEDPTPSEELVDTTSEGEPSFENDAFLDDVVGTDQLGLGGPYGSGPFGNRGPGKGGPPGGGKRVDPLPALRWLVAHQDADGKWDADGFMKHDTVGEPTTGAGHAEHDVGVTGLALLALLGDGHTTQRGEFRDNVSRGVKWLLDQQDPDTGLIGERIGHSFLYDHGIATLALCEAYYFSRSPLMKSKVQKAVSLVTQARNPYGVWRYELPPNGDADTSVTGWMVLALKSAQEAGLVIDSAAFPDALSWFDEVTDPRTGRAGYAAIGEASSRIPSVNDHYPVDGLESMTSVAILCRAFLGQTPEDTPAMRKGAELLRESLPEHDEDGLTNDMYYWYYGSYAMYQLGGRDWKAWSRALDTALVRTQRQDGNAKGSWDPDGPWGMVGGRVYSTALGALCCEAYYRYSRVLGGR